MSKPKNRDPNTTAVSAAKLLEHVKAFIEKHEITGGENIYQSDSVQEDFYEFVEKCCEIAGYKEIED